MGRGHGVESRLTCAEFGTAVLEPPGLCHPAVGDEIPEGLRRVIGVIERDYVVQQSEVVRPDVIGYQRLHRGGLVAFVPVGSGAHHCVDQGVRSCLGRTCHQEIHVAGLTSFQQPI
jgi:hypothetical protein